MGEPMKFITQISGKPGTGTANIVFRSGAVSTDLTCAQFFMKMQDAGKSLMETRAYAQLGPSVAPDVNWTEIQRVLDTFAA